MLLYISTQRRLERSHDASNLNNFTSFNILDKGRLFEMFPSNVDPQTVNYNHQFRISINALNCFPEWKILSTGLDKKQQEFVAAVEHTFYPFYGVQFHPERINGKISDHISIFFLNECRKNRNIKIVDDVLLFS